MGFDVLINPLIVPISKDIKEVFLFIFVVIGYADSYEIQFTSLKVLMLDILKGTSTSSFLLPLYLLYYSCV